MRRKLGVEEPSEEYQESPITHTIGPVYDSVSSKSEQDVKSEKLFAISCLFDELQRLPAFTRALDWICCRKDGPYHDRHYN
jgi:hypothetical protein